MLSNSWAILLSASLWSAWMCHHIQLRKLKWLKVTPKNDYFRKTGKKYKSGYGHQGLIRWLFWKLAIGKGKDDLYQAPKGP